MGTLVALALLLPAPFGGWAARSHAPLPPGEVTIRADLGTTPCGDVADAAACSDIRTGTVYMPTPRRPDFYHELGHIFDARVLTDSDRTAFAAIFHRRYDPAAYWQQAGTDRSLAEWFAEGYKLCSLRGLTREEPALHAWLFYAYDPSIRQQRRVCALIRRATFAASEPATA